MSWREGEGVLELLLLRMRGCGSKEECREAVEEVLTLVKERKLERLKEDLWMMGEMFLKTVLNEFYS
ncbi:MAG: hypothetical protein ABC595_03860 [Candidatus Methanosuratincola petrocarbonis]